MLTRHGRRAAAAAGAVACVLGSGVPALAQDGRFGHNLKCSQSGCQVGVHSTGTRPGGSTAGADREAAVSTTRGDPSCLHPDLEFAQSGMEGPPPPPPDSIECTASASSIGQEQFDPVVLAEQARAMMRLPEPGVRAAPPLDALRFVNMPQWMWVDAADWSPVEATASVSAGSVTVTATPSRVIWETGDGSRIICAGPGTAFSPAVHHLEDSPDCGHTYTALPPAGPGETVDLTADWEWQVAWSASDGRGGDLDPLTTTSTVPVRVSEIHSVVTDVN